MNKRTLILLVLCLLALCNPAQEPPNDNDTAFQTPPRFPGGTTALAKYLHHVIQQSPCIVNPGNVVGKVSIRITIDEEGWVIDAGFSSGEENLCNEFRSRISEAIKGSPSWEPGIKGGKAVKSYLQLPICLYPK